MSQTVFTIGHSTHAQEYFISLLSRHGITALCDVRSKPYSRVNPQFDREELKQSLQERGIKYVFLGKELGARSEDPTCYENGKVQYDRLAHTDRFREGLGRVRKGMNEYRIALMCAEKEPLECHRTILVARYIAALGLDVQHILADGGIEGHTATENRLKRLLRLPESDMFRSSEEILADAYRLQEERIAFQIDSDAVPGESGVRSAAG
jgi:uncharacterized protein (DUF488 family)